MSECCQIDSSGYVVVEYLSEKWSVFSYNLVHLKAATEAGSINDVHDRTL